MVTVYGIKNCDSVKKAITFLKKNNLEYKLFDFKEQKPSLEMINSWLEQTQLSTLFNSRSTTYRNLKLKELNLDDEQKKQWLAKEPLLIKRPVIEADGKVLVGFDEQLYKENLL